MTQLQIQITANKKGKAITLISFEDMENATDEEKELVRSLKDTFKKDLNKLASQISDGKGMKWLKH